MNQYSQLLYFLKQLAEGHPLVNTVTKGLAENIDLEKANIFPLVHITIDEATFVNGQTIGFNVTLECLTERNLNKKVVSNKFWRQDNEVDNHNETLAILNFMWTSIFRDWNENNMTTSSEPTLNKIEFAKGNILDGWSMTFEVEVPNTQLTLCDVTFEDIEAVISSGTGGTVKPGVGTFALTYGSNNAYYAEPASGYRFLKWLYDNVDSIVNPIAIKAVQSYTLVAQFIKQWQLTTSVDGEGTITPESGLKDDGNITITVTPTNILTHEFEKIEITPDGEATQTVLTNPYIWALNKATVIVGYVKAILQNFTLTVTKTGYGTIDPDVGVYPIVEGTQQTFTATETDSNYYLDAIYKDNVAVSNPYIWTADANRIFEARFLAWQKIMDVFSTVPVQQGDDWIFPDSSDYGSNAIIRNVSCATFTTFPVLVNSNQYLLGQTPVDITIYFKPMTTGSTQYLIGGKTASATSKGLIVSIAASGIGMSLLISNGSTQQSILLANLVYGNKYNLRVVWNGVIGGSISVTLNNVTTIYTATHEWTGNSAYTAGLSWGSAGAAFTGSIYYAKVLNGATQFEYVFNHGQSLIVYNLLGGVNGTAGSAQIWANRESQIEPFEYTRGVTIYLCPAVIYLEAEKVTNSSFDTTDVSFWNIAFVGVTVAGNGLAVVNYAGATTSLLRRNTVLTNGQYFKVVIVVSSYTSGSLLVYCNNTIVDYIYTTGTYTIYVTGTADGRLQFNSAGAVMSIDSISVRRIDSIPTGLDGALLPICYNKPEQITGFTRVGWFPSGSGAIKRLGNTYYISGITEVIPDGEYTIEQLIAYESDKCIVTQDSNVVSRIEVIGKPPYTSPVQGTEEEYIIIEEDNVNKFLTSED